MYELQGPPGTYSTPFGMIKIPSSGSGYLEKESEAFSLLRYGFSVYLDGELMASGRVAQDKDENEEDAPKGRGKAKSGAAPLSSFSGN